MATAVLFSGGKDSSLASLLLDPFYDVTLVTGTFGLDDGAVSGDDARADETDPPRRTEDVAETARRAADAVGFPIESVSLEQSVAEAAVERMVADGFPRNGIQQVHEHALEVVADGEWDVVADGTRRDDRVPTVDPSLARSLEDRFDVDYVAPLAGFGRAAVDGLADDRLCVESGPSEAIAKADYETELRALMAVEHGAATVDDVFPEHAQSRVVGRRSRE